MTWPSCHVLFAGGIHDARPSSMVAAMAAPLAERGARSACCMGTAYLFTDEAVATGPIVEGFQEEAMACDAHGAAGDRPRPRHALRGDALLRRVRAASSSGLRREGAAGRGIRAGWRCSTSAACGRVEGG